MAVKMMGMYGICMYIVFIILVKLLLIQLSHNPLIAISDLMTRLMSLWP